MEISKEQIETKVDKWVENNLYDFSFRPYQKEYIIDVIYSILTDNHLNIIYVDNYMDIYNDLFKK